ncbi:MAG: hypothetical protein EKK40_08995 [Bradyrhizobiaceae bacterium]|nr:MAG: hypothetical protein EKK40_08995 [Bradyrhizobiaceae bacterium]
MALLDHGRQGPYTDDDRTYLISRNQPPIERDGEGAHVRRAVARAPSVLRAAAGWVRGIYVSIHRAIVSAKFRRLQRELMWHGIPYSYLLEDRDDAVLPRPDHGERAAQIRMPVELDAKWD